MVRAFAFLEVNMGIRITKRLAGSDSFGNEWPEDGAVVEVPVEQAIALLAIKDAGFSEAPEPQDSDDSPAPPGDTEPVEEPAPEPDNAVDEAPKPRSRPTKKPAN